MTAFELRVGDRPAARAATAVRLNWSIESGHRGDVWSPFDPWLSTFGRLPDNVVDLVRFATGVYFADLMTRRPPTTFTRTIELTVEVVDAAAWTEERLDQLADLLAFLTADEWHLTALPSTRRRLRVRASRDAVPAPVERVALLSGGLDSFAGAVVSSAQPGVIYVGHWDQSITKAAQDAVRGWLVRSGRRIEYVQMRHALRNAHRKNERLMRSRAFLFMTLGVAVAAARRAHVVEIPENGFTSLNPPLTPDRRGALSTRSTHPWSIASMNALLAGLGIGIVVVNPYELTTKGELVRQAAAASAVDLADGVALTLSCAKLNGNWLGGNVHLGCGLCVADLVRRGALSTAGVADTTRYNADELSGTARATLRRYRQADLDAVEYAVLGGISEEELLALGPFPDDFDLDAALELCRRGLDELDRARRHVG
jgi:7-cyano-7-deazaguanine synthase in queuosine biosynthesis